MKLCVVFCVSLLFLGTYALPSDRCTLDLKGTNFFTPLLFKEDGSLLHIDEDGSEAVLNKDETIILSCQPNFFKEYEKVTVMKAKCVKNQILSINNTNISFEDLSCDLRSIEEVLDDVSGCSRPFRGVKFGYTNPVTHNSLVIGEACYATEQGRTVFVHSRLRNENNNLTKLALQLKDENYFKGAHPSNHYRIEFLKSINAVEQQKTLNRLLGSGHNVQLAVRNYIENDFLAHSQYQIVKKFSWNSFVLHYNGEKTNYDLLKKDILELGVFNLEIYSGGFSVLSLKNKQKAKVNIYLRGNKYPVPKYIWTVVKNDDKAVVFVLINNSGLTDEEVNELSVCNSKCEKITWINNLLTNDRYKKKENGYVLCCELSDIRNKITEIPDLVDVVGLFK